MSKIIINKDRFLDVISHAQKTSDISILKNEVGEIKNSLSLKEDKLFLININENGDTVRYEKETLISMIDQILEAQTKERALYYLERLRKSIDEIKVSKINDINLNRWKEYNDILTDSLWIWEKRDNSGVHMARYWGNFIPQIPNQVLRRYTKKGDWVLDAFLGSGTTLIECKRLGRNGIGIELNPTVAKEAEKLIVKEVNEFNAITKIVTGDSKTISKSEILDGLQINKVQLIILHPPYHDIIKFSKEKDDLSNAPTLISFLEMFAEVVNNITPLLEDNRYLVLVIGDKFSKGEWIPLAHLTAMELIKRGFTLKSSIVKNIENTLAKRNQEDLWRYRALAGGFYIFKHEYIMIFKKTGNKQRAIDEIFNMKLQ